MARIYVVPVALNNQVPVSDLCADLESVYHLPVELLEMRIEVSEALDVSRRQYHSARLLAMLIEAAPAGTSKLLGITSYDLFLPVLTFLFGQAQVDNRVSIFSTFRLHNEFYGLPASTDTLYRRSLKEAVHELGHTFGLRHCLLPGCAMNASTYVEDIDLKEPYYCSDCDGFVRNKIAVLRQHNA